MDIPPTYNPAVNAHKATAWIGVGPSQPLDASRRRAAVAGSDMPHASPALHPNAVIAVKDPRSGMAFYVEDDGHTLVAVTSGGRVAWRFDVAAAAARLLPELTIRRLRLAGGALWVACGRRNVYMIDVATGKVRQKRGD